MKAPLVLTLTVFSLIFISGFATNDLSIYWETQVKRADLEFADQSFCFEDETGIQGQNIDQVTKPASVSKLYTTLWAMERLGPQFRFKTQFHLVGDELFIEGGFDPYFVSENIMLIMDKLFVSGTKRISKIHFDSAFSYNWTSDSKKIASRLLKVFKTNKWDNLLKQTYHQVNRHLKQEGRDPLTFSSFSAAKASRSKRKADRANLSLSFESSPIIKHFKQVNMYSNNFYTDAIFNYLGGEKSFNDYITTKLNTNSSEIYFYTGSGLGANYTTCRLTLRMLEELSSTLEELKIDMTKIIAVPGSDAGTMEKRFQGNFNKKIVAKSGTLNDTSAFAGYLLNDSKTRFAVLNQTTPYADKTPARNLQDNIVKEFIRTSVEFSPTSYLSQDYISISDSKLDLIY